MKTEVAFCLGVIVTLFSIALGIVVYFLLTYVPKVHWIVT
jgi:hypothetical protein